ncbi:MAG: ATP-binding protein [Desulfobacterales bacterium]
MTEITRHFTQMLKDRLTEDLNFIQVVTGPRQVGKTTGLQHIVAQWSGPSLFVTADEMIAPSGDWLRLQWHRAEQLGRDTLFVVDEVQKIPEWSDIVKFLFDKGRKSKEMKVVLLGSASLSLQKGLSESLAGRYELVPAHHWCLAECRQAFGWGLEEFLKYGGYPASAELTADVERWQSFIRNSIIEPVLIKDILGIASVNKPALFRQTFELSMAYPAQEISYQKLLGQLQESGNVTTIKHYLELLEGAFLLKSLHKYSGSEVRKRGSSPKILPLNTALVHAFKNPDSAMEDPEWRGRIFESAIGAALSNAVGNLYYWREGNFEVDFVLCVENRRFAIEVKSGRRRHSKGMAKFLSRFPETIPLFIDYERGEELLGKENINGDVLVDIMH